MGENKWAKTSEAYAMFELVETKKNKSCSWCFAMQELLLQRSKNQKHDAAPSMSSEASSVHSSGRLASVGQ
jgi:hypothetical protein